MQRDVRKSKLQHLLSVWVFLVGGVPSVPCTDCIFSHPANTIKVTAVAFSAVVFCQLCVEIYFPLFNSVHCNAHFVSLQMHFELALGNGKVHNGM